MNPDTPTRSEGNRETSAIEAEENEKASTFFYLKNGLWSVRPLGLPTDLGPSRMMGFIGLFSPSPGLHCVFQETSPSPSSAFRRERDHRTHPNSRAA